MGTEPGTVAGRAGSGRREMDFWRSGRLSMSEKLRIPDISRRDVLKGTAAAATLAAAGSLATTRVAQAASTTVKGYGVTTSQLKDWSIMEKAIGITMEFTGTNADIGTYMRDVISNDLGETHDIFIFDGGTEDILGPQGYYATVIEDHPNLELWGRTSDDWKRTDLLQDYDGNQYGVPVIGNADSFGYFPEAIGANPEGLDEIPWSKMFEDEDTKGRVSLDRSWLLSSPEVGLYLKANGRAEIEDVANMTGEEARVVADFAADRKRAGQFRSLHAAFEEQVQLLSNKRDRPDQLLGAGYQGGQQHPRPRHGDLRLHGRGLLQVGPWRLHAHQGRRARQRRQHLQGAQLLHDRRVSRLSGDSSAATPDPTWTLASSTRRRTAGRRSRSTSSSGPR